MKKFYFLALMFAVTCGFSQPPNDTYCDATVVDLIDETPLVNQTNMGTIDTFMFTNPCDTAITDENNTVWYQFVPTEDFVGVGIDIFNSNFPEGTEVGIQVFGNFDCSLNDFTQLGVGSWSCSSVDNTIRLLTNFEAGITYLVQLSTLTDEAGNFDILFQPLTCGFNDDCMSEQLHAPIDFGVIETRACDTVGCISGAAVGFGDVPCFDSGVEPTVWYKFSTNNSAVSAGVALHSAEILNPHIVVYSNGCGSYDVETDVCSATVDGSGVARLYFETLPNHEYTIGVSSGSDDTGHFNLCISIGYDDSVCNKNASLTVVSTSDGSPLEGPYLPGESVSFEYTVDGFYQVNCNWLIGIVPFFEGGWASSSFEEDGKPVIATSPSTQLDEDGEWSWWSPGVVTYNVNNVIMGFDVGQPVDVGGWYFIAPSIYYENPSSPNESWGDGDTCVEFVDNHWLASFTLTVDENICQNDTRLSVAVIAFGDGEVGAWYNLGCTGEVPVVQNSFANCTNDVKDASEKGISVYPNPATDKLYIRNRDNVIIDKITLYNQVGQMVLRQAWTDKAIDVSGIAKGIYFVAMDSAEEKYRMKVVLE